MDKIKAGIRSTEFYMALLGAVLPVLNANLGLNIPSDSILGIAGVIVSYVLSRAVVKSKAGY